MFAAFRNRPGTSFLEVLYAGLQRLNDEVYALEQKRIAEEKAQMTALGYPDAVVGYSSSFGSGPDDTKILNDFVWYASSTYCLLDLFDFEFGFSNSEDRFPDLIQWRNKVAAHTARSDPILKHKTASKIDTPQSRDVSVAMHPEWMGTHYEVGGLIIGDDYGSTSHKNWNWGLVPTHAMLTRYLRDQLKLAADAMGSSR